MSNKEEVSYWSCWWTATWVLFVGRCLLGYLSYGEQGLGVAIGSGIIAAPLGGLFFGWIYWLIKK
jgi:hypothetical protein